MFNATKWPRLYRFVRYGVGRYLDAERSASTAKRELRRYEKHVKLEHAELVGGKTKLGEEPKDFSRIIAANVHAEAMHNRTIRENQVRFGLGLAALVGAIFYRTFWSREEDEINTKRKQLGEMFSGAESILLTLYITEAERDRARLALDKISKSTGAHTKVGKLYCQYTKNEPDAQMKARRESEAKVAEVARELGFVNK